MLHFFVLFTLPMIKFGHTQMSVTKISIPMSKTGCINHWSQDAHSQFTPLFIFAFRMKFLPNIYKKWNISSSKWHENFIKTFWFSRAPTVSHHSYNLERFKNLIKRKFLKCLLKLMEICFIYFIYLFQLYLHIWKDIKRKNRLQPRKLVHVHEKIEKR